jgi:nucleotide-binding universal stress UspA family protein
MFQRILVPLDGSERAEQAVATAAGVVRATRGSLVLLQVLNAPAELLPFVASALEPSTLIADESAGMSYLQALAGLYSDIPSEVAVRTGLVANTITTFAEKSQADAIFLTSQGEVNPVQRLLGDIAERVVHSAPMPVLMLREPASLPAAAVDTSVAGQSGGQQPLLRFLVPLDGSPDAELAVRPAAELAAALAGSAPAKLDLVRVIPAGASAEQRGDAEQYLQATIARLQADAGASPLGSVTADWAVAQGQDPAELFALIANQDIGTPQGYSLVALATPPASRANHWPFGDVVARLLHSTTLSLLLVHPPRKP